MFYVYEGRTSNGTIKKGVIEAGNRQKAILLLKSEHNITLMLDFKVEEKWKTKARLIKEQVKEKTAKGITIKKEVKVDKKDVESLKDRIMEELTRDRNFSPAPPTPSSSEPKPASAPKREKKSSPAAESNPSTSAPLNAKDGKKLNLNMEFDLSKYTGNISFLNRIPIKEIVGFTNQLATLLESGVSILNSLETIQIYTKSKALKKTIQALSNDISRGAQFSEALANYPQHFPEFYTSMVIIGESSGRLPNALRDINKFLQMKVLLKKEIVKSSIYPIVIFFILIAMLILMSFFVVPQFKDMFSNFDMELPLVTKIIFAVSDHIVGVFAAIGGFILTLTALVIKNKKMRAIVKKLTDKMVLKLPVIKSLSNNSNMYQLSLTLGLMIKNGIRLIDALELVQRTISNRVIGDQVNSVRSRVETGEALSTTFAEQPNIDSMFKSAIGTGEQSGKIADSLETMSEHYEVELKSSLSQVSEIIQPVSIVLLALILVPIIIGIFLPIAKMASGDFLNGM